MDLFIGAQLVKYDKDTARRELYGKAGAFREKDYGVEYRTPSNYWITSQDMMRWVYGQCELAEQFVKQGNVLENDEIGQLIQDTINESSIEKLVELNDYFGI